MNRNHQRQYSYHENIDRWYDRCNNWHDETPVDWPHFSWAEQILEGICGCGNPEEVVAAMCDYLQRVDLYLNPDWPTSATDVPPVREDNLADLLLAYMADNHGLTEHGTSIFGVWLTPAGRRWLHIVERESKAQQSAVSP